MEPAVLILNLSVTLTFAVLVGLLAKRKNRDPWVWGVAGALSWLIALVILAFKPYQCPKCEHALTNTEGAAKTCPFCGPFGPEVARSTNRQV